MVAQTDAGRGSATERADQGSGASQAGSVCASDLRGVLGPPSGRCRRMAEGGGPRRGGRRCAAEASAEVLCSARTLDPRGEGHAAAGRFGHRVDGPAPRSSARLAGGLLVAPLAAEGRAGRGRSTAFGLILVTAPLSDMAGLEPANPLARGFVQGLRDLGYVEGQNLILERRSAEGRYERFG